MAIAEQFAGLQMDQLIGGPLTAAADASTLLANSTADFINRVGFNQDGKVRTVSFSYHTRSVNDDGTSNLETMRVDVPMLAIVPIPNLQIDEVNILFDMEVKQSEKSEKSLDLGASMSGSVNLGIVKVSVSGSVSSHSNNTRSSDNSAKYHVDVRATNHGIPEGLARVLDMMAVNISPALVSSTLKDSNGQDLSAQAKERAERLKALRQEISTIEAKLKAGNEALEINIKSLTGYGDNQLDIYKNTLGTLASACTEDNDPKVDQYHATENQVQVIWNNFREKIKEKIRTLAQTEQPEENLAKAFSIKAVDKDGNLAEYTEQEQCYSDLSSTKKIAIDAQKRVFTLEKELAEKKTEYSNTIANK